MTNTLTLSDKANMAQREASDPFISAWVSASAGSGKTKVLTDRVLRLLLAGNAPETILCLTYTKAAAAEMANRLSKTLRDWIGYDDVKLLTALKNLTGEPEEELTEKIAFARTLFAKVLDTNGGMKIMTIHSFCQNVLKRFPLEAGVSPSFEIIEETAAGEILSQAIRQTLQNPTFAPQMHILSAYVDEAKLLELLQDLSKKQMELMHLLDTNASFESLQEKIYAALDVRVDQTEQSLIASIYDGDDFHSYQDHFLTKDGQIRKNLKTEKDRQTAQDVFEVKEKIKALQCALATCAYLKIALDVFRNFDALKQMAGVLDYTDLILKTRALLEEANMSAWVLYKLDGGIDHILLDEAQDTSPDSWAIIRAITEEFFAGAGRKEDKIRTLFAVGDKKQSIYRFQGADANEFERMRLFFTERIQSSENEFKDIPLNISFRSTQAVLDLVNYLLRNDAAKNGVLRAGEDGTHFAFRSGQAGIVEVWPLEKYQKVEKAKDVSDILTQNAPVSSACERLSEKIADRIAKMLNEKEILTSQNRPICAGDIMILVRGRDRQNIVGQLVRALKKKNIPVAGVDRLTLNEHIAVMDLISLGAFLSLPDDDLSLAEVLKSPLFNISEEQLFDLSYDRGDHSLWSQVAFKRSDIYEALKQILKLADTMPPFELYSYILDVLHMREKFLQRLGNETNEMLDEFLNLALNFEKNHSVSLESFLQFLKKDDIKIKRDLDNTAINAVRIMTVHGSKGLQSNIVFLPDAYSKVKSAPALVWKDNLPIWTPYAKLRTETVNKLLDQIADAEDEEYNRLLYVALTRAQDRLYICGFETGKAAPQNNWYDMVAASIPGYKADNGATLKCAQTIAFKEKTKSDVLTTEQMQKPAWFDLPAPPEQVPSKPLSPSKLNEEEPAAPSPLTPEQEKAMQRGTFIHKLLQHLPDIAPEKRADFIKKMTPQGLTAPLELLDLLAKDEVRALFDQSSLPEVPIIGTISNNKVISGQIDRLVVKNDEVLIIDYKTNRYPPESPKDIPLAYIEQMQAYKDLLKNIFSDKKIRCFLLWTTTLTLMEIK